MNAVWSWAHDNRGLTALFLASLIVGAGLVAAVWNLAAQARLDRKRFAVESAQVKARIQSATGSTQVLVPRQQERFPVGRATVVRHARRSSDEEAA